MTRILLRCPKDPFEVISPEEVALKNLIGSNSGNLLFLDAAYKILNTRDVTVTPDMFKVHEMGADYINEHFDVYVIPLANGFRVSFMDGLERLTSVTSRLKIPVVLLGGGLQAKLPYRSGIKRPQDKTVKAFIGSILDRSPAVGVRGEYTQDYLKQLGFKDVEAIGCPSMFMNGLDLDVEKKRETLGPDARISMSITARITEMGPIVMSHVKKYPNLTYVGQEMDCLRLLLWGEGHPKIADPDPLPVHASHPLIRDGKTRFWVDPWPWIDYLRGTDFAFGTRIHGNIAALLAGTPAYVLGHDTRTTELARYFDIPYREMTNVPPDTDAADLYAEADYGPMIAGHPARFANFTSYMERHGLKHVFQPGEDPTEFDRRIAQIDFPPTVELYSGSSIQRRSRGAQRAGRNAFRRARSVYRDVSKRGGRAKGAVGGK